MNRPVSLRNYHDLSGKRLSIGGVDFEDLLNAYGSPLYVYDLNVVRLKYRGLRESMPSSIAICYAVKSNPNPAILRTLADEGCGFDVASQGELYLLRKLGITGDRVLFTGPGKRDEEIEFALAYGIRSFNCESVLELTRIDRIATSLKMQANVGLRIHTSSAIEETAKIIGGSAVKKFGIDEDRVGDVIERCRHLQSVRLSGIHVFNASQVLDYRALVDNTRNIVELARRLSQAHGLTLDYIDVGGGLGIPYAADERELDIKALGAEFELMQEGSQTWILEPGRYLSGECGILLTRIVDVKETSGRRFVITEAGLNTFLRPTLVGQNHPVSIAGRMQDEPTMETMIEGPLCTALDNIGRNVRLPDVKPGEVLAFFNAGAYGFTESMPFFLSHPVAAEAIVDQGIHRLVRHRQEPAEYIDRQFKW